MAARDEVIFSKQVVLDEHIGPAAVVVRGEVIHEVIPGERGHAGATVDLGNLVLMPGVVDTHVHVNEPGRTDWEGFETAGRAAAAGGITTIVDMPLNSLPVTTTVDALEQKRRAAHGKCLVDVGAWGGVVPGNRESIAPLFRAGVLGFKCFLVPSGIPEFEHVTESDLRPAMTSLARLGSVLLVHAEMPARIERAAAMARAGSPRRYARYLASRPPEAEMDAIE